MVDETSVNEPSGSPFESTDHTEVPIKTVGFDETLPVYANECYIAVDPMSLHLVFTRFFAPPAFTTADQEHLDVQGFVPSEVVARIIVPPLLAKRIIKQLQHRLTLHSEIEQDYEAYLDSEDLAAEDSNEG
jgi:hypothetical protein